MVKLYLGSTDRRLEIENVLVSAWILTFFGSLAVTTSTMTFAMQPGSTEDVANATALQDGAVQRAEVQLGTSPPLAILTSTLPIGNPNVPYFARLLGTGGSGNFLWQVLTGLLPNGLGLDPSSGAIEGLTGMTGDFSLTFSLTDLPSGSSIMSGTITLHIVTPGASDPALPLVFLSTSPPDTSNYTVKVVPAGADLQAAIQNASCSPNGTILRLTSGATFQGNFRLPAKTCAPGQWIIIRTDIDDSQLPAPNIRIDPSYSPILAKIFTNLSTAAISTVSRANHYWLMGVEIGAAPALAVNYEVVRIGKNERRLSDLPSWIVLDRCYVHGNAKGQMKRGVQLNGADLAIVNSYFENFHQVGFDAQALSGWNGAGPLKIVNNFLEASGEIVIFGGADPTIVGLIPADIEIRRNHFFKPLSWKSGDPTYGGILWQIKNWLELKNAQRVLVEGNLMENNWAQAQAGYGVLFTPRNQNLTCPQCVVADVTFRYNVLRHTGSGFQIAGEDEHHQPSQPTQRVNIHDNLMADVNGPAWGGAAGQLFTILNGGIGNPTHLLPPDDITIDHNTGFNSGTIVSLGNATNNPISDFIFTNNIANYNKYGIIGGGSGVGNATLADYFTAPVVTHDVFIAPPLPFDPNLYPPNNFFPPDDATVQFVDFLGGDFRLAPTSPFAGAGTDGRDIGGDISAVNSATAGVVP